MFQASLQHVLVSLALWLTTGVNDGRMIFTQIGANFRYSISQLSTQIHGDLSRCTASYSAARFQLRHLHMELCTDRLLNIIHPTSFSYPQWDPQDILARSSLSPARQRGIGPSRTRLPLVHDITLHRNRQELDDVSGSLRPSSSDFFLKMQCGSPISGCKSAINPIQSRCRRSSISGISLGNRSLEETLLVPSYKALKVWKNSSLSVLFRPGLDIVDHQHIDVRYRSVNPSFCHIEWSWWLISKLLCGQICDS